MVRDYSQEYYLELCENIREINRTEFFFLTDGIEDLWNTFSSWIGWLKIEGYLDNVSEYHKKVLDQHNTTEQKLEKIFEAVREIDVNYATELNSAFLNLSQFTKTIRSMNDIIDPHNYSFNLTTIRARSQQLINDVKEAKTDLDTDFTNMTYEMGLKIMEEAGVEMLLDIVDSALLLVEFMAKMAINPVLGAATGWEFINSIFTIAEDLTAIAMMPVTFLITMITGDDEDRLDGLKQAEAMKNADGIADGMELDDDMPNGIIQGVKALDAVSDAVGLYDNAEKFVDGIDGVRKADKIAGYIKEMQNDTTFWKNVKNIYKWSEAAINGELVEKIIGKSDLAKIAHDTQELMDDVDEIITPWLNKALA